MGRTEVQSKCFKPGCGLVSERLEWIPCEEWVYVSNHHVSPSVYHPLIPLTPTRGTLLGLPGTSMTVFQGELVVSSSMSLGTLPVHGVCLASFCHGCWTGPGDSTMLSSRKGLGFGLRQNALPPWSAIYLLCGPGQIFNTQKISVSLSELIPTS